MRHQHGYIITVLGGSVNPMLAIRNDYLFIESVGTGIPPSVGT
jgi:hypothetical protein